MIQRVNGGRTLKAEVVKIRGVWGHVFSSMSTRDGYND